MSYYELRFIGPSLLVIFLVKVFCPSVSVSFIMLPKKLALSSLDVYKNHVGVQQLNEVKRSLGNQTRCLTKQRKLEKIENRLNTYLLKNAN